MYSYKEMKPKLFTEEMQVVFLEVRDRTRMLLANSGAATMGKIIDVAGGDAWELMACVDRLVELNEIIEISYGRVIGQNRIFVK